MPLAMRMRIMKWPGVGRRMNTPTHLSRSLSSSPMVFHPSRANRTRSSWTSSPSFSALSASVLFIADLPSASGGDVVPHGTDAHGAGLELRLLREGVAPGERQVVRRLVEAPVPAPVKGQEARALADRLPHPRLRHRLAPAGGDLHEVAVADAGAPGI